MQTRITGNSIHSNNALGIDLITPSFATGVTPNDTLDVDAGGNGLRNYPVLSSATLVGPQTLVSGVLASAPSASYRVEFFASPACDSSGFGECEPYLGGATVSTDAAGDASFSVWLPASAPSGSFVTATATREPLGATSEFSACIALTGQAGGVFCSADAALPRATHVAHGRAHPRPRPRRP